MRSLKWIILAVLFIATLAGWAYMVPFGADVELVKATGDYDRSTKKLERIKKNHAKIVNHKIKEHAVKYRANVLEELKISQEVLTKRNPAFKAGIMLSEARPDAGGNETISWAMSMEQFLRRIAEAAVTDMKEKTYVKELSPTGARAIGFGLDPSGGFMHDLFTKYGDPVRNEMQNAERVHEAEDRVYVFWAIHQVLKKAEATVSETFNITKKHPVTNQVTVHSVTKKHTRRVEEVRGISWNLPDPNPFGLVPGFMVAPEHIRVEHPYDLIPFSVDFVCSPAVVPKIVQLLEDRRDFLFEITRVEMHRIGERSGKTGGISGNSSGKWKYLDYRNHYSEKGFMPIQAIVSGNVYRFKLNSQK